MSLKAHVTVMLFILVIFSYVINRYDFFPVISKALSPVIIGFVIAYLLDPLVRFFIKMSKGKIKRGLAILLSILVLLGFIVVFGAVLVPSIISSAGGIIENINYLQVIKRIIGMINKPLAN